MAEIPLDLPIHGISDDEAFSKQDRHTARDARNMRGIDPTNGRRRPAQRSGLSKANSTQIVAAEKVAEIASVIFDSRNITYDFTAGAESVKWAKTTSSKTACLDGVVDDQGNLYALDGDTALVKFNPDGAIVWEFSLPNKDEEDVVRWVHVDDLGDVYTGVSDGRRQSLARIWKMTQLVDDKVEVAWEIETKAFIERGKVRQDKLYTIQNENDTKTAWVRVYESLDTKSPELTQEFLVPYPARGMDIKKDGSVVMCAPADGDDGTGNTALAWQRGPNPKFPKTTPVLVDWTPYDLDDFDQRVWSWYAAEDIGEFDVAGELKDGVEVLRWPDRSDNGRDLFRDDENGVSGPVLATRGMAIWPSVRFSGTDDTSDAGATGMTSLSAGATTKAFADQQKTILPAYDDSMFCVFAVCRPALSPAGGTPQALLFQSAPGLGGSPGGHRFLANRAAGSTFPGTFSAGDFCVYGNTDGTDSGDGSNGHALESSFDNENDLALVTLQYCGGVETGNPGTGFTRSMYRLNGVPIDRYEGLANEIDQSIPKSSLGFDSSAPAFDLFLGDVLEIIVIDRRDRDDNLESSYGGGVPSADGGGKVLQHEPFGSDPGGDDQATGTQADTELTRFEGYLAHKYGFAHLLPNDGDTYPHPYGASGSSVSLAAGPPPDGSSSAHKILGSRHALVAKYNSSGKLIWTINGTTIVDQDGDLTGGQVGGIGYDVIVNSDGNIYSMGPTFPDAVPAEDVQVCMLVDNGATVDASDGGGAWGVSIGDATPDFVYPKLAIDEHDNLYVPVHSATNPLRVYKKDGTLLSDVTLDDSQKAHAIAVHPRIPDYDGDLTDEMAENVYVMTDEPVADDNTVHKVNLVTATPATGSPRTVTHLAIAGDGTIKTFAVDGGAPSEPTGASGALSSTAIYYQAAVLGGEIVISDGVSDLQVFNPRDDEVVTLESESSDEPPHRSKIVEAWRSRLFCARAVGLIDDAFAWSASKIGNKRSWDKFPADGNPAAAIASTNARGPGPAPDIINGFIPYNDDIGFILGDHSIWLLTGDPGDGGEFDLVSDEWGGAFGRAWAKDPEGHVYFFGSRGGLFRMPPGGIPERITKHNIERRLRAVDLGTNYIRMSWNEDDEGLHIFQFPYGSPSGSPLKHWFWDTKNLAPWEDLIGSAADTSVQPTAVVHIDGDESDDRILLVGSEDGYIRKWDKAAFDDDSVATDAFLTLALSRSEENREMMFKGPRVVLAPDQDGAEYELFGANTADVPGVARKTGVLGSGRNLMKGTRVRGSYCFIRIRNNAAGQRFAIEEVALDIRKRGRKRVRTS